LTTTEKWGQVKLLLTPNIRPVPFFGVWCWNPLLWI
jgi:hypothetical protein